MLRPLILLIYFVFPLFLHSVEPINAVIEGNQRFAFDLYRVLHKKEGNLFFSPYSISNAFAMTAAGAKDKTSEEMLTALHLQQYLFPAFAQLNQFLITQPQQGDPSAPILNVANAIWVQEQLGLLDSFKKVVEHDFSATVEQLDFLHNSVNAVGVINRWIAIHTNGKIPHLLSTQDVSTDTRLVLSSAIYMRAQWLHVFNEHETQNMLFHINKEVAQETAMMQITDRFSLYVDKEVAVIALPYVQSSAIKALKLVMVIALPTQGFDLSRLEEKLSFAMWQKWMAQMQVKRVQLLLPKFKIDARTDLNDAMQKLGMKLAFDSHANFSGITGIPNLFISKALHQAVIDVDERGTEAAAATAVMANVTSFLGNEEPYPFIADHPFYFMIIDQNSGSILFMGRLATPVRS